jgi:iron complex outermembrane recepter protein
MQLLRSLAILPALMIALGLMFLSPIPAVELKLSTVRVTVLDSITQQPLVRASVTVDRTRGGYTNDKGVATIGKVKPGKYTLSIKYVGYKEISITNFVVADTLVSRTICMSRRKADSITIEARRLMVEKSSTASGRKFSVEEVQNTPGRQRLDEIIKLTPGVMKDNDNGALRINGDRSYQNSVKINGVETQDVVDGHSSAIQRSLSKFAITELDIKTSGGYESQVLGGGINVQNEEYKAVQEMPYKLVTTEPKTKSIRQYRKCRTSS